MKQLLKLIAVILENLPEMSPERIQQWIEAPQAIKDDLSQMFAQIPLKVWRTIKLVAFQSADQCRQALKSAGYQISDCANDLLGKIDFAKSIEEEAEFVKLTVAELGFANGATFRQIIDRALEMGLTKCQSWDGPAVRMAYPDQPLGEWMVMGMDAMTGSDGPPRVFDVRHDARGLWLGPDDAYPDNFWYGNVLFVFRRK